MKKKRTADPGDFLRMRDAKAARKRKICTVGEFSLRVIKADTRTFVSITTYFLAIIYPTLQQRFQR